MGREKSDLRIVASKGGNAPGAKAETASEQAGQLCLFGETADSPKGADGVAVGDRSPSATFAVPKSPTTKSPTLPAMTMEEMASEKRSIARLLVKHGVRRWTAWKQVYRSRGLWSLSHRPAVERALSNAYFAKLGLVSLIGEWERGTPSASLSPQPQPQLHAG